VPRGDARALHPHNAFDAVRGFETVRLSFIVQRPTLSRDSDSSVPKTKAAPFAHAPAYATDKPRAAAWKAGVTLKQAAG